MNSTGTGRSNGSGRYEIRLQGRLTPRWAALFEGMTLTTGDGITLLEGWVVDQAALHGLLHQLRDVGLPLVSVTRVAHDEVESTPNHPRTTSSGA